jgi:hypothetical protein
MLCYSCPYFHLQRVPGSWLGVLGVAVNQAGINIENAFRRCCRDIPGL